MKIFKLILSDVQIHTNGTAPDLTLVQASDVLSKSFSLKCNEHKDAIFGISLSHLNRI